MPESVNLQRGERRVARNKLNSFLSTMSQFAQNNIFSNNSFATHSERRSIRVLYQIFHHYFDERPIDLEFY